MDDAYMQYGKRIKEEERGGGYNLEKKIVEC